MSTPVFFGSALQRKLAASDTLPAKLDLIIDRFDPKLVHHVLMVLFRGPVGGLRQASQILRWGRWLLGKHAQRRDQRQHRRREETEKHDSRERCRFHV